MRVKTVVIFILGLFETNSFVIVDTHDSKKYFAIIESGKIN